MDILEIFCQNLENYFRQSQNFYKLKLIDVFKFIVQKKKFSKLCYLMLDFLSKKLENYFRQNHNF